MNNAIPVITVTPPSGGLYSLRDKLSGTPPESFVRPVAGPTSGPYKALKSSIHLKLLDKFDLAVLETLTPEVLRQEIATMVERLLMEEQAVVNGSNAAR